MKKKKSPFNTRPSSPPSDVPADQRPDGSAYHTPVLFKEAIELLQVRPNGIYVDCTFGGGGHSRGILERLDDNGRLFAFDQDEDAKANVPADKRVVFIPGNFRHIQRFLRLSKVTQVDGIIADLGVSSHQFDEGGRGFSTRFDGPLDMRMDQKQEQTAAGVISRFSEQELHKLFEQYGEITNSKTLARHIAEQRRQISVQTIAQLKSMVSPVVLGNPNKYFAQLFQALRIEVNDEMGALKEMLEQVPALLKPLGRIAIITFHSIEDRIVKNFFRQGTLEKEAENPLVQQESSTGFTIVTKKPISASDDEVKRNARSRSAKLRVAERTIS